MTMIKGLMAAALAISMVAGAVRSETSASVKAFNSKHSVSVVLFSSGSFLYWSAQLLPATTRGIGRIEPDRWPKKGSRMVG